MSAPSSNVIVTFRVPGPTRVFTAPGPLQRGDAVVVHSDKGAEAGTVAAQAPADAAAQGRVVRAFSAQDHQLATRLRTREAEARGFCKERIRALGLAMKLIAVEINHEASLAVFSFTSPERVDFRALLKELAKRLKMRIELRQIGVRDAARYTGGTGSCGRSLCCATWLPEFQPISIRMAKDQNLALNQQKLSGLCGRLRCCLQYEQSMYQERRRADAVAKSTTAAPHAPGVQVAAATAEESKRPRRKRKPKAC